MSKTTKTSFVLKPKQGAFIWGSLFGLTASGKIQNLKIKVFLDKFFLVFDSNFYQAFGIAHDDRFSWFKTLDEDPLWKEPPFTRSLLAFVSKYVIFI